MPYRCPPAHFSKMFQGFESAGGRTNADDRKPAFAGHQRFSVNFFAGVWGVRPVKLAFSCAFISYA